MKKATGFITLHRQILDWEWYGDAKTVCLFLHLLLTANYEEGRFQGREIHRGQLVTSLTSLSTETGLSVRQTRTALDHLISTGEVTNESTPQYRVITIVNYSKYQDKRQSGRQTTDKQPTNESTNERQTERQTERQQYNNNNNNNKETNKQNNNTREVSAQRFTPPTLEEVTAYCKERGNGIDPQRFIDYYSVSGWIMKSGRKMRDWKAAVRTWEGNEKKPVQASQQRRVLPAQDFEQRDYSGVQDEILTGLAKEMAEFKAKGGCS